MHDFGGEQLVQGAVNLSISLKREKTVDHEMARDSDTCVLITKITAWDDFFRTGVMNGETCI